LQEIKAFIGQQRNGRRRNMKMIRGLNKTIQSSLPPPDIQYSSPSLVGSVAIGFLD